MNWFEQFSKAIRGEAGSSDLVGAGTASAERAMSHYRFQHQAKVKEAIEETFPLSIQLLKEEWTFWWKQFWASAPDSPRSLDFFGEPFMSFINETDLPVEMKELFQFEWFMEKFSWTHCSLGPVGLQNLNESSKIILAQYSLLQFKSNVTKSYEEEQLILGERPQTVLLWMKESRVHFKAVQKWEVDVLKALSGGLGEAMEFAPDDASAVSEFFKWLGESNLVREIHNI